jgi:hypothetical protein
MSETMRTILLALVAVCLLCAFSIEGECPADEEPDIGESGGIIGDDDDDTADVIDDDDDDVAADDDDDDDNDTTPSEDAPVISKAEWAPNPVEQDVDENWFSNLEFEVCDKQDDLEGGFICVYLAGQPSSEFCVHWTVLETGVPSAPDCATPAKASLKVSFDDEIGLNDDLCIDLEVSDGKTPPHWSNRLTDICVFVP